MNIKIKQNDYVQPTEVRENIVQSLCDIILDQYLDKFMSIPVYVKHAELYIGTYVSNKGATPLIIARSTMNSGYTYERVHSCEVNEAFKSLQDAGYFIFMDRDKKTKNTEYKFSKKPVLNGVTAKNMEFDMFID